MTTLTVKNTPDQKNTTPSSTSRLEGSIHLILHTKIALSLFNGSWRYHNMGLLQFAKMTHDLYAATKQDDPYAEWYLMKCYENIHDLHDKIKSIKAHCKSKLEELHGFEIQIFTNPSPVRLPLQFSNPFSYMGAYLMTDLDYALRQAYTLKQIGIILEPELTPAKLMPSVRRIFSQARQWQYTGVKRKDVKENNQVWRRAKELMGDVPLPVVIKEIQFDFLPKVLFISK